MTKPTDEDVDYSGKQASTIMIEDFGYRCADALWMSEKAYVWNGLSEGKRFILCRAK